MGSALYPFRALIETNGMGTSCWAHISTAIDWIREVNPRSVLDVGVGFGKWGFLCREYLDVFNGRHFREDWKIRIIGIEGFEKYLHPASRYIYDDIVLLRKSRRLENLIL